MAPPTTVYDYYAILEIPRSAKLSTIEAAYGRLLSKISLDHLAINDPKETAEFRLLQEAHEQLRNPTLRQQYDKVYRAIILPAKIKQRIPILEAQLRDLQHRREELTNSLQSTTKDLAILNAEKDIFKRDKERVMREKAAEERWWPYLCSFMPGKATRFRERRQQRERDLASVIGKQRTGEKKIGPTKEDVEKLEQQICFLDMKIFVTRRNLAFPEGRMLI